MQVMKKVMFVVLTIGVLALIPGTSRAQDDTRLVHEAVVNAPVDQVWMAFTTSEGLESWMAAHAKIDFKIGGAMKTQYDPKGTIDDAKAIENAILSYEPLRMLSFKVTKAPDAFPFPNANHVAGTRAAQSSFVTGKMKRATCASQPYSPIRRPSGSLLPAHA